MDATIIIKKIQASLDGARVDVKDLTGTMDHWQVTVTAPQFRGKSLVEQHRMIYAILHNDMEAQGGGIHALSINTVISES
ncbi:MAG: BolA/IbaG family iron-sulfur metabolism protein [Nitrospirae bacterium]|nr:BolA/IbaG family iron-sulfur metabolism protein [Nitrospirota bacterium]